MGNKAKKTFPQERYTNGQWVHEKMLSIISHWRNENPRHNEGSSHSCNMGCSQKTTRTREDMERRNPCAVLVGT